MKILHSKTDELNLIKYRCAIKAKGANKRFVDQITKTDILNCLKRFSFKCAYCTQPIKSSKWQLDHFYAKAMGGKNIIENICPCCRWCNTMKNALDGWAFIHRCKVISKFNAFESIGEIPSNYKNHPIWKSNG